MDRPSDKSHAMVEPFMRLPAELRAYIWELTIFPRLVQIEPRLYDGFRMTVASRGEVDDLACRRSNIPPPSVLHTCREARRLTRYQKAFSDGCEPRYTWINFEYDMVSFTENDYLRLRDRLYTLYCTIRNLSLFQRIQLRTSNKGRWVRVDDMEKIEHEFSTADYYPSLREMQRLYQDGTTVTYFYRPDHKDWIIKIVAQPRHIISADASSGIMTLGDWRADSSDTPKAKYNKAQYGETVEIKYWGIIPYAETHGEITNSEQFRKELNETIPPAERHVNRLRMAPNVCFIPKLDTNQKQVPTS